MKFRIPSLQGGEPPIRAVLWRLWPTRTQWGKLVPSVPSPALGTRWELRPKKGYAALIFTDSLQASGLADTDYELEVDAPGEPPRFFGSHVLVVEKGAGGAKEITSDQWLLGGPPLVVSVEFLNLSPDTAGFWMGPDPPEDPGRLLGRMKLMLREFESGWVGGRHLAYQMVMWELDAWSKHGADSPKFLKLGYDNLCCWARESNTTMAAGWSDRIQAHYQDLLLNRRLFTGARVEELTQTLLDRGRALAEDPDGASQKALPEPDHEILEAVAELISKSFRFWLGENPIHPPHPHNIWQTDCAFALFSKFATGRLRTLNREGEDRNDWEAIGGQPDSSYFSLFAQLALAVLETPRGLEDKALWIPMLGGALAAQPQFFSTYGPTSMRGGRSDYGPKNLLSSRVYRDTLVRAEDPGWPTIAEVDTALESIALPTDFLCRARRQCGLNESYAFHAGISSLGGPPPWRIHPPCPNHSG